MKVFKSIALVSVLIVSVVLSEKIPAPGLDAPNKPGFSPPGKVGLSAPAKEAMGGFDAPLRKETGGFDAPLRKEAGGFDAPLRKEVGDFDAPMKKDDDKDGGMSAPARRRVVTKVDDRNEAHHDIHEMDGSHWVAIDGVMTRLNSKEPQTDVSNGSEDINAQKNVQQGLKAPEQGVTKKRRVVKKVRSTSKHIRSKQEESNEAHHDIHEMDGTHWIRIDGVMTRLHPKAQTDVSNDRVYHGSEDKFAQEHGHQGQKIADHEIISTKRSDVVTRRARRNTFDELNGGHQAPTLTFIGMWSGSNLHGGDFGNFGKSNGPAGLRAPVYGRHKFKQGL